MSIWNLVYRKKDDDGIIHAIVKSCKLDDECKAVENMNNNLLLDTRSYQVYFDDGMNEVLTVNIIDKNLLAQVDE